MTEQKLRVWWIPQIPMKAFYVNVSSIQEAKKILEVLANYDIFQFENKVKGDYSNAGGLQFFEEGANEWNEWENENGENIDEVEIE
jgi:stage III sporulation protein SpoIIIAA